MKITCQCGSVIPDSTDFESYKAALVADQDRADLEAAIRLAEPDRPVVQAFVAAEAFQCECGRLVILRNGQLHWFTPIEPVPPLLYSVRGPAWPRPLIGHWRNNRGELFWASGVPGDEEDGYIEDIGSWNELESFYHQTFERLLAAKRLRSSFLKRDGKTVHRWPPRDR